MSSQVKKFYTKDLAVRVSFVDSTELCNEICSLQNTDPFATIALGRLITGTVLLASQLWENQSLSIRLEGDGPLGHLYAESSFEGKVRAYISHPRIETDLIPTESLDISKAVGQGVLIVNRNIPFQKAPHTGIVPIVSGEISQDIAYYLQQSHQTPSVVSLTVTLNSEGKIKVAGGVLLELTPGAPENTISQIEKKAQQTHSLSQLLLEEKSAQEIVSNYTHSSDLVPIDHSFPLMFFCKCSTQRVEKTLSLLGRATLAEMILKGEDLQVKCEFCSKQYQVAIETLRQLLHSLED